MVAQAGRPALETRRLLEGPITSTLLRLAAPTLMVVVMQVVVNIVETYFIGRLGTDALAGASLVFPALMLMTMMAAGGMGGAVASALGRALGAGRRDEAQAIVAHAVVIAAGLGLVFTVAAIAGGPTLYRLMGGNAGALAAALQYSNPIFAASVAFWLLNALSSVLRGTGNMIAPALVSVAGAVLLIPMSPALIMGWGPLPPLGMGCTCEQWDRSMVVSVSACSCSSPPKAPDACAGRSSPACCALPSSSAAAHLLLHLVAASGGCSASSPCRR